MRSYQRVMESNGFNFHEYWPQGKQVGEDIVMAWLQLLLDSRVQASTIMGRISALKWAFDLHGIGTSSFQGPGISRMKAGIIRQRPNRGLKSEVLTVELLQKLKDLTKNHAEDMEARRLLVILLLAYAAFARAKEMINLRAGELTFTEQGLLWNSSIRKTDNYRQGQQVFLAAIPGSELCPRANLVLKWSSIGRAR